MMLVHPSIAVMVAVLTQAAPTPVAPPATNPAVPAAPAPPALPASTPLPKDQPKDVIALDLKPLKPKMDTMHDVLPSTGVLARCPSSVVAASPAFTAVSPWLTWRATPDRVELLGKNGAEKSTILGTMQWKGTAIEWSWVRFSATSFAQALADAERLLPWMAIRATLDDGKTATVLAPSIKISRVLTSTSSLVLKLASPTGQALTFDVENDAQWTTSVDTTGTQMTCKQGTLHLTVDATGRAEVKQDASSTVEVALLRKQIAERTRELTQAIDAEKPFIEAELQQLRTRLVEAQAQQRKERAAWPIIPQIRIRDEAGRVYAVLELQVR